MNCAEFEILLADSIDGTLPAAEQAAFEGHLETCLACAALAEDARSAVAFMARAWEVEPPPALLRNILQSTQTGRELKAHGRGVSGWINRIFAPVLQPRIVLGTMMTLLSVAMIGQLLRPASLNPVRLWTAVDYQTNRIWDRAVKDYESTPLVYEVRAQVDDWADQQRDAGEGVTQESK